ncbi:MAG TPA: GNAT family N-acetyltransferase, partial [Candidatus Blautia avistercoris]|nr:GNAT family N-acetyltransferase [Candidatus Blautia avistercoris]
MIEIKEIRRNDYKKAQKFAIQGMHLDWYMDSKVVLALYAKYFWCMELNRATKVYGAYVDDTFVGVLLAEMKNEPKCYHSLSKAIYVKIFDWLQRLVAGKGVGEYDEANKDMYNSFCQKNNPDGEII